MSDKQLHPYILEILDDKLMQVVRINPEKPIIPSMRSALLTALDHPIKGAAELTTSAVADIIYDHDGPKHYALLDCPRDSNGISKDGLVAIVAINSIYILEENALK